MKYWSLNKFSALPNQEDQNKLQPGVKPQVQPTVQPQPGLPKQQPVAPTAPTADPNADVQSPNPNAEKMKPQEEAAQSQEAINPTLIQIAKEFANSPDPVIQEIFKSKSQKDKNFLAKLNYFFIEPAGRGMAWYKWFTNSDVGKTLKINKDNTNANDFAIKRLLDYDPDKLVEYVKGLIKNKPLEFADAVSRVKYDRQQGQWGNSVNKQNAEGKEQEVGEQGRNRQIGQMLDDDYVAPDDNYNAPDRNQIAIYWQKTKPTKNNVIAPTMTPHEQQGFAQIAKALQGKVELDTSSDDDFFGNTKDKYKRTVNPNLTALDQFIHQDAKIEGKPLMAALPPEKAEAIIREASNWWLKGISDMDTGGGPALTNWQEYLLNSGVYEPQEVYNMMNNPAAMAEGMKLIEEDLQDPSSNIGEFMKKKTLDYVTQAHEIERMKQIEVANEFRPQPGDLKSFRRMARIASACAMRDARIASIPGKSSSDANSKAGSSVRRSAYVDLKINSIIDKIESAYEKVVNPDDGSITYKPNGKMIPFGQDDAKGIKRYLFIDDKGLFNIRSVRFDDRFPVDPNSELFHKYIADERNKVSSEPFTTPLTMFNFSKIGNMVTTDQFSKEWMDKIGKQIKGPDGTPLGLKRPIKETKVTTPLMAQLSEENKKWLDANPGAPDRLAEYRKALGRNLQQKIATFSVPGMGGQPLQGIDAVFAAIKKAKTAGGPKDPVKGKEWLQKIIAGEPVDYRSTDFDAVAEALKIDPNEIYGHYLHEYDKYNKDDVSTCVAQQEQALQSFGQYFVHRIRVQNQRGFKANNWGHKSVAAFIHMCNPHSNFKKTTPRSTGEPYSEVTNTFAPLHDAINNEFALSDEYNGEPINSPEQANEYIKDLSKQDRKSIYGPSERYRENLEPDGAGGFIGSKPVIDPVTGLPKTRGDKDPRAIWDNPKNEANPVELMNRAVESYRALNPGLNTSKTYEAMQKERIIELGTKIKSKESNVARNTNALNDPAQTMARALIEIEKNDVEYLHREKQINKDASITDDQKDAILDKFKSDRLNELAAKQSTTPEEFAKTYLEQQIKADQGTISRQQALLDEVKTFDLKSIQKGLSKVKGNDPSDEAKASRAAFKKMYTLIVPSKYKSKAFNKEDENSPAVQSPFRPLDYIDTYTPVDRASSIVKLTVKTAMLMEKLFTIKSNLEKLAMPVELVERMIENTDNIYDRQLALLDRRFDGRTNDTQRTSNHERRRLWSLS